MFNKSENNDLPCSTSKTYFEQILENSDNCFFHLDSQGYFVEISENIAVLSDYSLAEILSRRFIDFLAREEKQQFLTFFDNQEQILKFPINFQHRNSKDLVFEMNALPITQDDEFQGYYGAFLNITSYKHTEEKLRQSETNLADAQRIANLGSWELDLMTNEIFWSDETYHLLGKPTSLKPCYDDFVKVIHPDDLDMVVEQIGAAMVNKTYDVQHRVVHDDGSIGILHERGEVIFDDYGKPVRMVGTAQNITALKEAEDKIVQLKNYDFLTELPNRNMFILQCEHLLGVAKQNNQNCALFCMGIDRFKLINESMGHAAGNELLKAVAERLAQYPNESDILARIGGDEFSLAMINISHADIAALFAQKIINHFEQPFKVENQEIVIGLSIGIILFPAENRSSDELLKDSQTAMHRAKSIGGKSYQFYSSEMTEQVKYRLGLEAHLRRALEQNEFLLYYQPKVSTQTGKISGAEALIRWQHPERGLVSPIDFVSVLEDTGLIVPVGEWALEKICSQYQTWSEMGFSDLSLALNLSVKQFSDAELCQKVQRTLKKFNHDTHFLELEVTESLLMDNLENAMQTLNKLHSLGIKLSIDDFGTGYSSLAYLKLLPVDTLKIDRSFVIGLPGDVQDNAIVRVIVMLAQALDLKVVAEGVETEEQLNFLIDEKCDYIQGYYYSRPLPEDEFTQLLKQDWGIQGDCNPIKS